MRSYVITGELALSPIIFLALPAAVAAKEDREDVVVVAVLTLMLVLGLQLLVMVCVVPLNRGLNLSSGAV
jgi:hypothetical protein